VLVVARCDYLGCTAATLRLVESVVKRGAALDLFPPMGRGLFQSHAATSRLGAGKIGIARCYCEFFPPAGILSPGRRVIQTITEILGLRLLRSPVQGHKSNADPRSISHNSRGATIGGGWARKAWSCTTFALLSE